MANDEARPSVAWVVHGDLAHVRERLDEVVEQLHTSAGRTADSVYTEWLERLLKEVENPATRSVFRELLRQTEGESHAGADQA